jgi:hypothetical protein
MARGEQERIVIASDIGQTVADGGLHYFRQYSKHQGVPIGTLMANTEHLARIYDQFQPLPNAQEGINSLSTSLGGFAGWYTVRPQQLQQQATNWLGRHKFRDPEKVRVSATPNEKLQQIVDDIILTADKKAINTSVVLLDDNQKKLIEAAKKMLDQESDQVAFRSNVLSRIILVGYGMENGVYTETGIRTFGLRSWERQNMEVLKNELTALYAR